MELGFKDVDCAHCSTPHVAVLALQALKASLARAGGSNLGLVGQNVHCRRQCVEARSADQSSVRSVKNFFRVIFQLPRWALVAPLCFALHCRCSLVSVQSVTVSLSTWKGNVHCAGSPRLLATSTSFSLLLFHFLAPPLSKSHVVLVSMYNQFVVREVNHRTQQAPG